MLSGRSASPGNHQNPRRYIVNNTRSCQSPVGGGLNSPSMASANAIFYPSLRAYQIWGTRQGVGKTIASTILCLGAIQRRGPKGAFYNVAFSKPVDDAKYLEELDYSRLKSVFFTWRKGKALPQWFDTRKPVDEKVRTNVEPF